VSFRVNRPGANAWTCEAFNNSNNTLTIYAHAICYEL
jgi:hypothetical protein